MNEKVIVGMSGGIDSSVAALLLKQQGYDVIGVTLKHLPDDLSENPGKTCCSIDDINDARMAAYSLEVPHYTISVMEEFKEYVIDYFISTYNEGRTPSPCVICDEKVKIKKLIEVADKMGAKYISTGHYSKKSIDNLLLWDKNNGKDQTYMLYRLDKEVIGRFIFPLESYTKPEIREIARNNNIHVHAKPDSQGICFAPNGYIEFLEKMIGSQIQDGNYLDTNGNIVGRHKGYQLYTVGQRKGLDLNVGHPNFVLEIKPETNEVVVGEFEKLLIDIVEVTNEKFHVNIEDIINTELIARPRFSSRGLKGKLKRNTSDQKLYFIFNERNAENSNGQHIVFYKENELIGGGEISISTNND